MRIGDRVEKAQERTRAAVVGGDLQMTAGGVDDLDVAHGRPGQLHRGLQQQAQQPVRIGRGQVGIHEGAHRGAGVLQLPAVGNGLLLQLLARVRHLRVDDALVQSLHPASALLHDPSPVMGRG
ncbi:hypothetical protein ACU635_27045 [[Actinomadura] parvosata]|uniref:hypothetical protein n=1 Tax=[Actinomadura] parvosata TaxID=1955412 RepID=UPI00406D3455